MTIPNTPRSVAAYLQESHDRDYELERRQLPPFPRVPEIIVTTIEVTCSGSGIVVATVVVSFAPVVYIGKPTFTFGYEYSTIRASSLGAQILSSGWVVSAGDRYTGATVTMSHAQSSTTIVHCTFIGVGNVNA